MIEQKGKVSDCVKSYVLGRTVPIMNQSLDDGGHR